ncbi:hypothetical protein [Asticcacaulis sp.]|uniref:hypothetical protein n=1 Tax=Asticcacaulis sp. TaxID=1872648 RepID=UPI002CD8C643|nr:hypothetical protein [Asticcacaulis sp.]HTM80616.1 hypothetical protein [Asticcacaulis sp.]
MKNRASIIAIAGLVAALFAIILNLAPAADANAGRTLAIGGLIAALMALGCGIVTLRKGGGWRFLAIAMIGPSVFVLADAGMRIALYLRQGV